jgi:predicted acyltransferase
VTFTSAQPLVEPLPLEEPRAHSSPRLLSLDVFRGLVILLMLLVNNLGDYSVVGAFWKHADWRPVSLGSDFAAWMKAPSFTGFPLFWHCTLADYVMPMFMLIIGVAIPFSVASARRRGDLGPGHWLRVVRRGAALYALGWAIDLSQQFVSWKHNPSPDAKLSFSLGMNVLQLLGVAYVVARVLYALPLIPRLLVAAGLFVWHWALLKYLPQGDVPAGTFTAKNNAVGYAYSTWTVFKGVRLTSWLSFGIAGMLSVPPAAATMAIGSWVGEVLLGTRPAKVRTLLLGGLALVVAGVVWAFDLPMNKPRWTPCYLVYCAGIGTLLIAALYWVVDLKGWRGWTLPLAILGMNAIGIYVLSILAKIWLLNLPRIPNSGGKLTSLTDTSRIALQRWTTPLAGSWLFTALFVGTVWLAATLAWRKKWVWKV